VSAVVNSRPLTVENLNDPFSSDPLTPNHLLTMKSKVLLPPPGKFVKPDLYLHRRWRRVQYIVNEFWSRWRKEYLNLLQTRSKWIQTRRNVKVGDIVMVKDDNMPRNQWKIAKVQRTIPSADGLVRKVAVKVANRTVDHKGKWSVVLSELERPVHKLVILKETEEVPVEEP